MLPARDSKPHMVRVGLDLGVSLVNSRVANVGQPPINLKFASAPAAVAYRVTIVLDRRRSTHHPVCSYHGLGVVIS